MWKWRMESPRPMAQCSPVQPRSKLLLIINFAGAKCKDQILETLGAARPRLPIEPSQLISHSDFRIAGFVTSEDSAMRQ